MFGLDMRRVPQSDNSCAYIAKHVSEFMKTCLFPSIMKQDLKIGVMINKFTALSKRIGLVLCIRNVFPHSSEHSTCIYDLVELNEMLASTIQTWIRTSIF
jgi:hypothetical protein